MNRTKFVLLLLTACIFCAELWAQQSYNVSIKTAIVDRSLNVKSVPKYLLSVKKKGEDFAEWKVATGFDGVAMLTLPTGNYVVRSADPLRFEEKEYVWSVEFKIVGDSVSVVELSNDNAKVTTAAGPARRRVSEAAELFKTLRNGVVTIEGELAAGSGFIFDERGLVLTNHHVIEDTHDIRVRFDKKTAVRARLIAKDVERDIAVLQINLAAFTDSYVLPIADTKGSEPPVIVGEHVFSIGSPAQQDKILTTGIVSKIEPRSILSDISFGKGSAGGPLFNSVGEVVGITTFRLEEREGLSKNSAKDSDFAGVIRIEMAETLMAQAREIASRKGTPSAELMPTIPDGLFPIETIKTSLRSPQFSSKEYVSDVKDYQVRYMTPVYKFYMIEKDRIESLKIRERRNKDKGKLDAGEMFKDLRVWKEYAGELAPAVDILALPETTATMKSMALSAITNMTVGYSTPLDHKYKADFSQMKLLCDGKEITPVRRTKTEIARDLQNYYKTKKRYTYAGIYTYPFEVFAPGQCSEMVVHVFSEEDIETPIISRVTAEIKNRIWNDFAEFRSQSK